MSNTAAKLTVRKKPSVPGQNCLWIALYNRRGPPHNHDTQYHWAYILGTKSRVLKREGIRFNVWKSHRLDLIPENKREHENKIIEPEGVRSTHGGCHTNSLFSLFQLAEIKNEQALRLHLMAHAIAEADTTRSWTCYDWVEAIFYDLLTDKSILTCLSTDTAEQIGGFESVMTECAIPGIHCHDSAWTAPEVTDHGILPRSHPGTSKVEVKVANWELSTSSPSKLLDHLRAHLSER